MSSKRITKELVERTEPAKDRLIYTDKAGNTVHRPPKGLSAPSGKMWCPYCNFYRRFKQRNMGGYLGYEQCEECGISTHEYYVKHFNGLMTMGRKK